MTSVKQVIDRIKNLKEFVVVLDLPETFEFHGQIPFHMTIEEGVVTVKCYAETMAEARTRVFEYFGVDDWDLGSSEV